MAMAGLFLWLVIFLLPWRPWNVSEALDPDDDLSVITATTDAQPVVARTITALIPARNENSVIRDTLSSLADQVPDLQIILIDDQSTDNTIEQAQSLSLNNMKIIQSTELPEGWSGKIRALDQGFQQVDTDLVLLLDADILLKPGTLRTLINKLETENLDFISLMASLRMENFQEKLLMPAFIYFFKLLYPFKLSNSGHPLVAAAAGGCILLKSDVLRDIGGFSSIKSAMIDDCTLAGKFRTRGKSTWIGLTHSAVSLRSYDHFSEIRDMVARTAYTQLRYSPLLLILCTGLMLIAYVVPIISLASHPLLASLTITIMVTTYLPVVLYYNLNPVWVIGLPLAGFLYLLITWISAFRYYRGERSHWKGRSYT